MDLHLEGSLIGESHRHCGFDARNGGFAPFSGLAHALGVSSQRDLFFCVDSPALHTPPSGQGRVKLLAHRPALFPLPPSTTSPPLQYLFRSCAFFSTPSSFFDAVMLWRLTFCGPLYD